MPAVSEKNRGKGVITLNLIINGERLQLELETVADIVNYYKLEANLVVTEVDGVIINGEDRETTKLQDGMKIEIVQFVGGG